MKNKTVSDEKGKKNIIWIVLLIIASSGLLFSLKWWLTVSFVTGH